MGPSQTMSSAMTCPKREEERERKITRLKNTAQAGKNAFKKCLDFVAAVVVVVVAVLDVVVVAVDTKNSFGC